MQYHYLCSQQLVTNGRLKLLYIVVEMAATARIAAAAQTDQSNLPGCASVHSIRYMINSNNASLPSNGSLIGSAVLQDSRS